MVETELSLARLYAAARVPPYNYIEEMMKKSLLAIALFAAMGAKRVRS